MNDLGAILELRLLAEQLTYLHKNNNNEGRNDGLIVITTEAYERKASEIGLTKEDVK